MACQQAFAGFELGGQQGVPGIACGGLQRNAALTSDASGQHPHVHAEAMPERAAMSSPRRGIWMNSMINMYSAHPLRRQHGLLRATPQTNMGLQVFADAIASARSAAGN